MMNFHPIENSGATAEIVVPILIERYKPASVLDLGCNTGRWLMWFMECGVYDVAGIDGDNMLDELRIPLYNFIPADLTKPIHLGRKFDLVMCLEVAEHLDEKYADVLVDTAIRHSDTVFWSAATPGQTGYNHVNEQPHEYWIEKFKAKGYTARIMTDELPQIPHDYYRKNAIEFKKNRMNTYSQNKEDLQIQEYFKGRTGTLLSVGENDGRTFSNALALIQSAWTAHLFEPGSVYSKLAKLHKGNSKVHGYNKGLGSKMETVTFYESEAHVKGGRDRGLVSTTDYNETKRWRDKGVTFTVNEIQIIDFSGWWQYTGKPKLQFISIDCEGMDWEVLQQIDLAEVGCEFLIIEWNGDTALERKYTEYCGKYGMLECARNNENLLFCLPKN